MSISTITNNEISQLKNLLIQIDKIIKKELYPILGISEELYLPGFTNIPNNLMEIRNLIRQANKDLSKHNKQIANINKDTQELLYPEILKDIFQLFDNE